MAKTVRTTYTQTRTVPTSTVVAPMTTTRIVRGYWESTISRIIWMLFGVLAFLLILRIIFLLLSANPNAGFTQFLYDITQPFVNPFENIFAAPTAGTSYFDTAALLALFIWGVVTAVITAIIDAVDRRI